MRSKGILFVVSLMASAPGLSGATETDQYTLPPVPLADVGPELEEYLETGIARILVQQPEGKPWTRDELAWKFKSHFGFGMPLAVIEAWILVHSFKAQPATFNPYYWNTVFAHAFWKRPIMLQVLGPTIKAFGVQFGSDKLGHFFQQGYDYYSSFVNFRGENKSVQQSLNQAREWGVFGEQTYYGALLTGVCSVADLASDFAGLQFYLQLTEPMKFVDMNVPALLVKNSKGKWERNSKRKWVISKYISHHWNEALNPSLVITSMESQVVADLKLRCPSWEKLHSSQELRQIRERLQLWHGLNYGHPRFWQSPSYLNLSKPLALDEICFSKPQ